MSELTDWNLVATFVTFAEDLGRADAASRLGISTRTLMRRIARFEQEVGVDLVVRSRNRPLLTPAGAWIRDEAGPKLEDVRRTLADARRHAHAPALRVAVSTDLPRSWFDEMSTWLADRGEPALLDLRAPDEALRMVRRGELDIVLLAGDPDDTPNAVVGHEPAVVAFPDDHPAAAQAEIHPGDLLDLPVAVSEVASDRYRRLAVEVIQGDPDLPFVVAPRITTIAQGIVHAARAHRAAGLVLAATVGGLDMRGLVARPLAPPHDVAVTLVGRSGLPAQTFRPLAERLLGVPGRDA